MSINCVKKLGKTKKYQVVINGNYGELEIVETCSHSNKQKTCANCYGKICKVSYEQFDPKSNKFEKIVKIATNHFTYGKQGDLIKNMQADNLIERCSIIREINKREKAFSTGKTTFLWTAYDSPVTGKTDCKECKNKYNNFTPCRQVESNREKGLADHFCGEQKQRQVRF